MKRVHLDHNSTTSLRPEVRELWLERLDALGGNASSLHTSGREARQWLDEARERTAAALGVHEDDIVFTSGGTESNNLALRGALWSGERRGGLLTTAVEHSAILAARPELEREGRPLHLVGVDAAGRPDLEELRVKAREGRFSLCSVMAANNEVGTLVPLEQVGALLEGLGPDRPLFHTDAVQALGRIPIRLSEWRSDLASFSLHKIGGPLGVGLLVRRKNTRLTALMHGGGQEGGLRPGTENVPAISAAALAVELAVAQQDEYARRTRALCAVFWQELQSVVPSARLLGPALGAPDRLPNTLNVLLPDVDGRVLVTRLDLEGLEVSAGSACASGSLEPSHVLRAMGFDDESARAGVRLSFGRETTREDINTAVDILRRTFLVPR